MAAGTAGGRHARVMLGPQVVHDHHVAGRPVVWPGRGSRRTDGRCPVTRGPSARGGEPVPEGRTCALRGGASHEAKGRRGPGSE